jgi:effector-binding domain-containing protein
MFDIKQRDVPEQLVLTEQRSVRASELPDFIGTAIDRLRRSAKDHGGVAGSWLVIYSGVVSEDAAVPVEVCAPIASAAPEAATRTEPAHREAYVRLRKEQVVFPEIQDVYRALNRWIHEQGLRVAAEPREIYFTNFEKAAPSDEVCDVAFPIRG